MEDNKEMMNEEMMNEEIKTEVVENEETTEKESVVNDESNNEEKVETSEGSESTEEDELDMIKKQNKKLQEELDTTKDTLLRLRAEYDNYRRRSIKEKEGIYSDAYVDVVKEILPVIDNLERAIAADGTLEDLKKGVEMTMKGCQDAFSKLGVEEIDATGEFDPNFHNAVMHIEDESLEKNVVAEVFQKGYKKDDKIIRHTMVKVAN
ncbi:nucleotide exchange factor GrpE [Clostridium butyricum]|uniref:nucleotide exchange factor GrpE n=1 Tax=Clostridium butyricum TaxID=1492 RepID=UPI00071C09A7|nr:nucleotide exchange factor GrpE [Clostridium butyricum]ALP89555.1 molecular chaperone GrpE [Clostridium butyricum]ALS16010.1 molecular chaperone GrpE [Clostridium butyricum]ANF13168.1 nucleotide exchange factor GrpE [Clostridium butyricum]AOR93239.1 nucleotide exchange factor GrpE [Clostridium butyricum]MCI3007352.1 nucleotide exchange factor GrpE [Clostridium butyricum]